MHLIQKQPALKNEAAFRTTNPQNRRNGQYLDVLPLAQNYNANASCRFPTLVIRTTRGWEAKGLAEEAKV
jgi:hypothetical protein